MTPAKKSKPILILTSSPRRDGNSTILAREAARGAAKTGVTVEVVNLAGLKIGPCRACGLCRRKGASGCFQDDDMKPLYEKVRKAGAVLIAGPVYWFSINAYTKLFMDRLYAFGAQKYRPIKGKRIGIILTYADADPFSSGAVNALRSFQDAFAYLQASVLGMVCASADAAGDVEKDAGAMKNARALGRKLAA